MIIASVVFNEYGIRANEDNCALGSTNSSYAGMNMHKDCSQVTRYDSLMSQKWAQRSVFLTEQEHSSNICDAQQYARNMSATLTL